MSSIETAQRVVDASGAHPGAKVTRLFERWAPLAIDIELDNGKVCTVNGLLAHQISREISKEFAE